MAQMVNWLNTSTGHQAAYNFTGTQGTSNYTFAAWSAAEAAGTNLYRHKDAFYFLPTEDEWFKAAYWNGTTLQGFANASPNDLVGGNPDPAKWNYSPSAGNEPWDVGSGVEELNGTYDMMGNLWELMESPHSDTNYGPDSLRTLRGGRWYNPSGSLHASYQDIGGPPTGEDYGLGFRVASAAVPEPSTLIIWSLLDTLGIIYGWRRRKAA